MRKIFERQIVDEDTGEIVTTTTVKYGSDLEKFFFARTTEGLEWIREFRTLRDLQVLMYLVEFQEIKSDVIIFTSLQVKECAIFFGCSIKTVRNSISRLIESNFLKRIAKSNYISNPMSFYKGGTKGFKSSLELLIILNISYLCIGVPNGISIFAFGSVIE